MAWSDIAAWRYPGLKQRGHSHGAAPRRFASGEVAEVSLVQSPAAKRLPFPADIAGQDPDWVPGALTPSASAFGCMDGRQPYRMRLTAA